MTYPSYMESWGATLLNALSRRCVDCAFAVDVSRGITVTYGNLLAFCGLFRVLVDSKLSTAESSPKLVGDSESLRSTLKRQRSTDAPSPVEGPLVAIVCNEGILLALAESSCLLNGTPFLPINPRDPTPRRIMLTTQFSADCEVSEDELWELLSTVLGLECTAPSYLPTWDSVINPTIPDLNVAYVITTSGSTGFPKGVVAERRNLRAYVEQFSSSHSPFINVNLPKLQPSPSMSWKEGCLGLQLSETSRVLLLSSCTFDPSIGDIANCLHIGSLLLCAQRSDIEERLWHVLDAARPTHVISTPALWQTMRPPLTTSDWLPSCKVFLGGEAMPPGLISEWADRVQLFNIYGVTEVTIYQCIQRVFSPSDDGMRKQTYNTDGKLAAGQAVNLNVYCESDDVVRPGDSLGEVVLVGDQVCRGYYDELSLAGVELRRKVFFEHQGRRAYRTGDIGVVANDTLWLGGRSDFQVKVNGQRVSLEECDQGILGAIGVACGGSVCTAAIPKNWVETTGEHSSSDTRIGAMCVVRVVGREEEEECSCRSDLWSDALALAASKCMPSHMVPSLWLVVFQTPSTPSASLPITSSGKVDRVAVRQKLLDELQRRCCEVNSAADESALTEMERLVGKEWSKLFGIAVKPNSDFFRLGGDSLSALKVVRAVYFSVTQISDGESDIDAHGNMPPLFSPKHLLTHSRLREYAQFLEAGIRQEKESLSGTVGSRNTLPTEEVLGGSSDVVDLFMEAVSGGQVDLVRFLLDGSFCPVDGRYTRDCPATTPLHIAISQQDMRMTVLLLDRGAKVTAVNGDGVSPTHLAAMLPSADFLQLFASRGVPMTVRDARQQSLLHSAARFGSVPCCTFLLSVVNIDRTIRDCWQRTALHWAVLNNHIDTAKCLIKVEGNDERVKPRLYRGGVSSKSRSDRLARRRTHLQYESVAELACRLYGDSSELALLCKDIVD